MKKAKFRIFALLLSLVMLASLFGGCAGKGGEGSQSSSSSDTSGDPSSSDLGVQTVHIGVCLPLSGVNTRHGEYYKAAIETAVQHIKEDNFLPDYEFEFHYYDDQGTTDAAPAAVNLAINDDVDFVISHVFTTMVLATQPLLEDAEIPAIGIVSGPKSVQQGFKFYHSGTVTDTDAAKMLAEYLVNVRGFEKVAILAKGDEGGMSGAESVMDELEILGKPAAAYELFQIDDTSYIAQVLKFKEAEADAIISYTLGGANAYTLYNEIESMYGKVPEDVYLCGNVSFANPMMRETWPEEDLEGLTYCAGYIYNPDDPFIVRFEEDFRENDPQKMGAGDVPARVYDAVWNIAQALKDMGPYDVEADDFKIKLNESMNQVKRTGVQGEWDFGQFDDGRGLANGNIGIWGYLPGDNELRMLLEYSKS